jgi:flagellar biosynthetic protein FlhB
MDERKTIPATPHKREEAKRKGQVARSTEVNIALTLLAGMLILYAVGAEMFYHIRNIAHEIFSQLSSLQINPENVYAYFLLALPELFLILAPLMLGLLVIGCFANIIQVGFSFTFEPLKPAIERISLIKGFANLFSKRRLVELVKSLLKVILIGYIGYSILVSVWKHCDKLLIMEVSEAFIYTSKLTFKIGISMAGALLFLALCDYAYQRWEHEQSIKMTIEEFEEEMKRTEGDPKIRARIRSVQREMARSRMMQEVPMADVVIVNPHEIAVAIKYDQTSMEAPEVVAKGARLIAAKIREIAKDAEVPIVENKPLAQTLFKTVEIGMQIPAELYKAVAEILAYVYQLKNT